MNHGIRWACLIWLLAATSAKAEVQAGSLMVVVEEEDGTALSGAAVTAVADATPCPRTVFTNADGVAMLELAPATPYVVSVYLDGFARVPDAKVEVEAGEIAFLHYRLEAVAFDHDISARLRCGRERPPWPYRPRGTWALKAEAVAAAEGSGRGTAFRPGLPTRRPGGFFSASVPHSARLS